jgi:hypothetical protein
MKEWIKVVTDPMGLAGFALFLVFTFLARKGKKPAWLAAGAFAMACLALAGGLILAYFRARANPNPSSSTTTPGTVSQPSPASSTVNQQAIEEIKQESSGAGAVNAAGVQGGSVTVNNAPASLTPPSPQEKSRKGKK